MLWGLPGDPPFDSVRRELARSKVPHVVLNQRNVRQVDFELDTTDGIVGRLTLDDDVVELDEIGAVYVRPYDMQQLIEESAEPTSDAEAWQAAIGLGHRLFAWTDITDARVINRPSAMVSNSSKPYQGELIRRSGFETPATLVTTTPATAHEFIARHEQVIYKSVSSSRSIATRIHASELQNLDDVAHCPTQFQVHVPGTDWRVHVVGDDIFACEIHCAADDYRCAELYDIAIDVRSAVLPESIAARCHALAHGMDLPLAGIDLRRTSDDVWYCFEVNPSPAFTYYEEATGQPLTPAVARLLSGARDGLSS
jgi:hypothetical protein